MDENIELLLEYFPELRRHNLKKTTQKQWDKFLIAFSYVCVWIHFSRSIHKNGLGIVLFRSFFDNYLPSCHRWNFDVFKELSPYIVSNHVWNHKKSICKEWIVNEEFKIRAFSFISDIRFVSSQFWIKSIIDSIIIRKDITITKGYIKTEKIDLNQISNLESRFIIASFSTHLSHGYSLEYSLGTNGRLYHPLQNIKRTYRKLLFHNWYSYDFKACAPSLLLQEVTKLDPKLKLPAIEVFIQNRTEIRKLIAQEAEIPEMTVKRALTGLFFGQIIPSEKQARWDISTRDEESFKFSLINSLGEITTQKLLSNETFMKIAIECQVKIIKTLAKVLKQKSFKQNGKVYLINQVGAKKEMNRWNSRQAVAHWYFGLERQVLNVAINELESNENQFILMHDGFITNKIINKEIISNTIKQKYDYNLELIEEQIQ